MKWIKIIAGGLLGVMSLGLAGLFAMSMRADAGHMHATIDIARPPDEVRSWFHDPAKLTQWVGWLVEVRPSGNVASGPGAQQEWFMEDPRDGGKRSSFIRTIAAEDDSSTTITVGMPAMFDGRSTAVFRPLPTGGTRVVSDSRFTYSSFLWRLLEPLVTPEAQKKEVDDLARLKSRIEAASPATPTTPDSAPSRKE